MRAAAADKVVVVGLDGLEPKVLEPLLAAGELPNLARLRAQGGYARVATTYPAQTPVAWSTFATGTNPGGHGIFDFIRRDPRTYLPDLALSRYEQPNAFLPPRAVNLRRGQPLWELLAEAGLPSTVLRCPCCYPPSASAGAGGGGGRRGDRVRILAGMGVPDLRGGLGTSTFYTAAGDVVARESEQVVPVRADSDGAIRTSLAGPRDQRGRGREDLRCPITIHPQPAARRVVIRCDGAEPAAVEVREGEWSDWLRVRFKAGLLLSVHGAVRFHLVSAAPALELYASPVNFDPARPLFPISAPPEYAAELGRELGVFYTTGMVEDHGGLGNGRIDEAAFLAQCHDVLAERERMLAHELDRLDEGFLFCLFDTPDRVQHMFWRYGEPDHPANRADAGAGVGAGTPWTRVIADCYRACDAALGRVLERADDRTLLMVLSDHGMTSFQRGVHLNTWLASQGLLAFQPGVRPGDGAGDFLRGVDWSRTRAYALGLGGIYLNVAGREEQGIVAPGEAAPLAASIARAITGLVDPQRQRVAVRRAVTRDEVYRGPYAGLSPDLLVGFARGYRASWETALGAAPAGCFADNEKRWGGDHIVDPTLVPGVLFMNRPFRGDGARLLDMAPTILEALGVPRGAAMEGEALLQ